MIAFPYYQYLGSVEIENHYFDGWLVERYQQIDEPADCASVVVALFVVLNRVHLVWILQTNQMQKRKTKKMKFYENR